MIRLIIPLVLIAGLAAVSFCRNTLWSDEIRIWSDVISKNPMKSRAYANIAIAYEARKMMKEAIAMNERAIERAPNPIAYNSLGNIYRDLGRPDKAIEFFSAAIIYNPGIVHLFNNRGIVYAQTGQYDKAVADYTRALSLSPGYGEAYVNLGNAYDEMGRPARAIEAYTKAIRLNPRYAAAYYNRGITLNRTGNIAECRSDFLQACSLGSAEACAELKN